MDTFSLAVGVVLCLAIVSAIPVEEKKSYRNFRLIRTQPRLNGDAIPELLKFEGLEDVSFWKYPSANQSADIMASPEKFSEVEQILNQLGLKHSTVVEDIEKLFENQNDGPELKQSSVQMSWDRYHRYNVILNYVKQQAAKDGRVTYETIGKTTEGRELVLVKISSGGGPKPAIFIDGGMHAREWISPAAVTYIMHNLITNRNYDNLVEMYDWYIVPVVNADGYEYTHTRDRMWRKTRRPNPGTNCYGTDPNRNWGFQWGGLGSSPDPCQEIYRGPRPFSEPETTAVANAILARKNQIKLYLTFHSYSQLWLLPWSYTKQKPSDIEELKNAATIGARALANTYGTQYRVGSAPDILYEAAGGSDDWAKGHAGIKYSYTLELRDTGYYGFALPASQISVTGEETLRGVAALAKFLHNKVTTTVQG